MAKIHALATPGPIQMGVDRLMFCGETVSKAHAVPLLETLAEARTLIFCPKCAHEATRMMAEERRQKLYLWAISSGQDARDMEGE